MGLLLESAEIGAKLLKKHGKEAYDTFMRYVDNGYPVEVSERVATGELDPSYEARMARKAEQGYSPNQTHGTVNDIYAFNRGRGRSGTVYTADDPEISNVYANYSNRPVPQDGYPTTYPLTVRGNLLEVSDLRNGENGWYTDNIDEALGFDGSKFTAVQRIAARDQAAKDAGYSGYKVTDMTDLGGPGQTQNMIFDPSNIRSALSAMFDPEYKGPNILGSLAATGGALGLLAPEDAEAGWKTEAGKTFLDMWHGSPRVFDEFRLPKEVGTSNAQMYSYGIYGSDAPDFAQRFRPRDIAAEEKFLAEYKKAERRGDYDAMEIWESVLTHDTPAVLRERFNVEDYGEEMAKRAEQIAKIVENTPQEGMLARVRGDVKPDEVLDWNKSVENQPAPVRDALLALGFDPGTGASTVYGKLVSNAELPFQQQIDSINEELSALSKAIDENSTGYRNFTSQEGADAAKKYDELMAEKSSLLDSRVSAPAIASKELDNLGIRGVVFDDPDLPASQRNYVVFDPKRLSIVEKGSADPGLLAATAAGGTAAATAPSWMDTANQYAGQALEAIDMPYKGYLGLSRLAGGLLSGEGLDTALNESVKQIRQPIEQTAMESGDEVLKRTGSPEAATLWNLIMQMGSPI